jgi:putative ABC transport system substrate-binding protein
MRRREFMAGLGSTAIAWPFDALAQRQALPSVAVLLFGPESIERVVDAAFRDGLGQFMFNRSTEIYDRLPALYGDLRRRGVAIIASMGAGSPSVTATAATPTIPVVFLIGAELDAKGLLTGLDGSAGNAAERFWRAGRNVTHGHNYRLSSQSDGRGGGGTDQSR